MANPLSKELREKIVSAYERKLGTIKEVAEIFSINERTVAKYLQIYRETGDLTPKPLSGRPPILTDENLNIIKKIIISNQDGTLRDFRDAFENKTGFYVAISTIQNACDKLDMNRKKKSFYAQEQEREDVKIKRENFINSAENISPEKLIFLDESGANLGMSTDYARAEGGKRAVMPKPFDKGEKFSIISAIALTGIIAMMYVSSAVDTMIFKTFSEQLLIPKLKRGQFVIFDNVSFHKSQEIIDLIEKTGAKVVFLPPYSPDLSPIEKMWSKIKEILKRIKPRTKPDFHNAISSAIESMNDNDFEEWYDACGYELAA